MSTNNSNLTLKSVYDILGLNFIIPKYQRGYRWTPTEVRQLLDDIWVFHNRTDKKQGEFYCLQPIVVKKIGENQYEVIDGQQRLTTIHIIISYLECTLSPLGTIKELYQKDKFTIKYETREGSESFLNEINKSNNNSNKENNIDFYHMSQAYDTIKKWFEEENKFTVNDKFGFSSILLGQLNKERNYPVVFIWYEINYNEAEAIDVFTRLNIGKIPLTNSELIKALLLKNDNFLEKNIANLKQIQIATEWDLIEKSLQDDNFWYFIYNTNNPLKYENRIEYILDLISGKKPDDEFYFTFIHFFNKINNNTIIDDIWLEIKNYYLILEEWYKDFELYHYIGFLIDSGLKIQDLLNAYKEETKDEFKNWLKEQIKKQIDCSENEMKELEYGDKRIKRILLLFNIQTIINSKNTDFRFSFKHYKKTPWDVEHVRSKTDLQITGKTKQKEWLEDIRNFLGVSNENNKVTNDNLDELLNKLKDTIEINEKDFKDLIEVASYLLQNNKNLPDDKFDLIFQIAQKYFKENEQLEDIDNISNLTLLDAETNRSYKNTFFPIKRRIIIENDKKGKFIPIATKNLFLKYYTKNASNAMYWTENDAENYLESIKEVLKEFFNVQNK